MSLSSNFFISSLDKMFSKSGRKPIKNINIFSKLLGVRIMKTATVNHAQIKSMLVTCLAVKSNLKQAAQSALNKEAEKDLDALLIDTKNLHDKALHIYQGDNGTLHFSINMSKVRNMKGQLANNVEEFADAVPFELSYIEYSIKDDTMIYHYDSGISIGNKKMDKGTQENLAALSSVNEGLMGSALHA